MHVMRAKHGDRVILFGGNREFEGVVTSTARSGVMVRLTQEVAAIPPPRVRITSAIPFLKGGRTEGIIDQLTQLGVARFVIFRAAREVARLDYTKLERFERVCLEACKQCRRSDVPDMVLRENLREALPAETSERTRCLVLHEGEKQLSLTQSLVALRTSAQQPDILIASGPEGGFSEAEIAPLTGQVTFVSLGPRILRAETAPIAAAAIALSIFAEL